MSNSKEATLCIKVYYDDSCMDADSIAAALDTLLETALSTPGILDEYGDPMFDDFYVQSVEEDEP